MGKLRLEWDDGKVEEVEAFSVEEMQKRDEELLKFGKHLGIFSEDFMPDSLKEKK